MAKDSLGVIRADEAYSKHELLNRLGISQRFWDQMLDSGLPYCNIGHARWVRGADVLEYMLQHSERRQPASAASPARVVEQASTSDELETASSECR
jgi:hypothetical protein